jgi:hypothetical protein
MDPFEKWMEEMAGKMAKEILFPSSDERLKDEHLKDLNRMDCFIDGDEDEESS